MRWPPWLSKPNQELSGSSQACRAAASYHGRRGRQHRHHHGRHRFKGLRDHKKAVLKALQHATKGPVEPF